MSPPRPDTPLGEFELLVLLAVLHVQEAGGLPYGSPVRDEIERRSGRAVARGAIYITLDRLAQKGLLASRRRAGSPLRGQRPLRAFRVTPAGMRAVRESLAVLSRMQRGLEPLLGNLT